ncbi:MAG TPA: ABC transporter permease subunit [Candidatus Dormibacteraeota bacterium]|jgi:NitT/TauT family transport system permease protein|nr:ABC transporter permease subunit [Candidatus Dormibacteraeota bacterium]
MFGSGRRSRRLWITLAQLALVAAFLAAWQWLPTIPWLAEKSHVFDSFFVSSPSKIVARLRDLFFGPPGVTPIWTYIWNTMSASTLGLVIGLTLGGVLGLILGSSAVLSDIFRPFLVALNAIPRIALIPIVVVLFGPTSLGSITVSVMVTFFVAFFNAYEGARSVAPPLIQNAQVLGAGRAAIMRYVRLPYVIAWTVAALPLAATFSVISVVTGELLIGAPGLGLLLGNATSTADATLTFSLVVILSALGVVTVLIADQISKRVLHWWAK